MWVQHSGCFFLENHPFGCGWECETTQEELWGFPKIFPKILYFHFPSILISPSLEECISGFFQHPARFCSAAAAGKSSQCLHLVPQIGKLEQATPAPPAVEVFSCDLWKHLTADLSFGILGPRLLHFSQCLHLRWLSELSRTSRLFLRRLFSSDCSLCLPKGIGPSWRTGHIIRN